jgi:hypothetical protein
MSDDVLKLTIALGSALIATLISSFKDEIKNLFVSSRRYRYLKGKWECRWNENSSNSQALPAIYDNIEIGTLIGRIVKGHGVTKAFGEWKFKGNISESVVTVTYKNEKGSDRSGVIILKLDPDEEKKLDGVWCQHKKGIIVTGTTEWHKL